MIMMMMMTTRMLLELLTMITLIMTRRMATKHGEELRLMITWADDRMMVMMTPKNHESSERQSEHESICKPKCGTDSHICITQMMHSQPAEWETTCLGVQSMTQQESEIWEVVLYQKLQFEMEAKTLNLASAQTHKLQHYTSRDKCSVQHDAPCRYSYFKPPNADNIISIVLHESDYIVIPGSAPHRLTS